MSKKSVNTQRRFVEQCRDAGLEPYTYNGRNYYHGFGVTVDSEHEVRDAVGRMRLQRDSMGRRLVVYPCAGIPETDMLKLADELGVGS
jgi:hypothetical protein